ncbi:SMI1/KNR4 family protein [Mucilaginibacter phyllosphaerae]
MENSAIYKQCDLLLAELSKFDKSIIHFGNQIADDRLKLLEQKIGFNLPLDFKYILIIHNGISLVGNEVYGIDEKFRDSSLDKVYQFEHEEVSNKMPGQYFPFSPDGFGNHYCFDLSKLDNTLCPVVFWQHDFNYPSLNEVEICHENFMEWVEEVLIEWTLEDINYDGTDK